MKHYERPHNEPTSENMPEGVNITDESSSESIADRLERAEAEVNRQKDLHLRALADLDNLRRRVLKEKEDIRKTATAALIEALLPALDSFRLGFIAAETATSASEVARGFKMAYDQLFQALTEHGLTIIDPKDTPFDPHSHDCIAQKPHTDVAEGTVLEVVRIGYRLGDKLLRPATVIIASAS